jgi:hypothetical protein
VDTQSIDRPGSRTRVASVPLWAAVSGAIVFVLVATANGAGYRYGASDQAFYIPVIQRSVDAAAFPRDAALIDAQGRLMLLDEVLGAVVRATGLSLEALFLAGYLLSLGLVWTGLVLIGTRVYTSPWAVAALAAAFALRHRIPRTSANSFEPYFHPRMLAFGIGLLATAAVLRRRAWLAVALVAVAAIVHITTAMWFAIMLGVALAILEPRMRRLALGAAALAFAVALWGITTGRFETSLARMDGVWLQAVASKDSLFATDWPAWAWAMNLGFLALLWWAHRRRTHAGVAHTEDAALVWGATTLVAVFLLTLPLVAATLSLPVQLQISRIFWLVDFLALVYVLAVVVEAPRASRYHVVPLVLITCAISRGAYIMLVERPERPLFAVHAADSSWEDAMRWVARQPADAHVLADPGHAWKYGTSVRAAAVHDVFLEEVKDSALAIYSRDVASRVVERTAAVGDFGALTADRARELAQQYDLDYLVTEADISLPVAYRNERFRILDLRDQGSGIGDQAPIPVEAPDP